MKKKHKNESKNTNKTKKHQKTTEKHCGKSLKEKKKKEINLIEKSV